MTISYQKLAEADKIWTLIATDITNPETRLAGQELVQNVFSQTPELEEIFLIVKNNFDRNFLDFGQLNRLFNGYRKLQNYYPLTSSDSEVVDPSKVSPEEVKFLKPGFDFVHKYENLLIQGLQLYARYVRFNTETTVADNERERINLKQLLGHLKLTKFYLSKNQETANFVKDYFQYFLTGSFNELDLTNKDVLNAFSDQILDTVLEAQSVLSPILRFNFFDFKIFQNPKEDFISFLPEIRESLFNKNILITENIKRLSITGAISDYLITGRLILQIDLQSQDWDQLMTTVQKMNSFYGMLEKKINQSKFEVLVDQIIGQERFKLEKTICALLEGEAYYQKFRGQSSRSFELFEEADQLFDSLNNQPSILKYIILERRAFDAVLKINSSMPKQHQAKLENFALFALTQAISLIPKLFKEFKTISNPTEIEQLAWNQENKILKILANIKSHQPIPDPFQWSDIAKEMIIINLI